MLLSAYSQLAALEIMGVEALVGQRPLLTLDEGPGKREWPLETRVCLWVHRRNLTPLLLWAIPGAPLASVEVSKSLYSAIVPRQHTIFSESDIAAGIKQYFSCNS